MPDKLPEWLERHSIHLRADRLLIQQIILQLRALNPKIVEEIYENVASELQKDFGAGPETKKIYREVHAHIAELLSGVGLRAKSNPKKPPKRRSGRAPA